MLHFVKQLPFHYTVYLNFLFPFLDVPFKNGDCSVCLESLSGEDNKQAFLHLTSSSITSDSSISYSFPFSQLVSQSLKDKILTIRIRKGEWEEDELEEDDE